MKKLLYFLFAGFTVLLLANCSSMRSVGIDSMRPAEITFPSYVNTLLLVDRTKFESGAVNIIEGLLTGEMPGSDKAAAQEALTALQNTITQSPRFKIVRALEWLKGNSITQAFPDALPWNSVEGLCSQYKAEAVVALEIF